MTNFIKIGMLIASICISFLAKRCFLDCSPSRNPNTYSDFKNQHTVPIVAFSTFLLALLTGLCIYFSDSFFYKGVAHYRSFYAVFGAYPCSPDHKWPIVFSIGAFTFALPFMLIICLMIYRGFHPDKTWRQACGEIIRKWGFLFFSSDILLLHYISCDFAGDRWFLLNQIYSTNTFSLLEEIYYYLHELTPLLLSLLLFCFFWTESFFSERAQKIMVWTGSFALTLVGIFFLIFDLWFLKWAIAPIVVSIIIAITLSIVARKHLKEESQVGFAEKRTL